MIATRSSGSGMQVDSAKVTVARFVLRLRFVFVLSWQVFVFAQLRSHWILHWPATLPCLIRLDSTAHGFSALFSASTKQNHSSALDSNVHCSPAIYDAVEQEWTDSREKADDSTGCNAFAMLYVKQCSEIQSCNTGIPL